MPLSNISHLAWMRAYRVHQAAWLHCCLMRAFIAPPRFPRNKISTITGDSPPPAHCTCAELVASRQLAGTGGAAFCAPAIDCKSCTSKSSCGWCASKRGVKCLASTDAAQCTNTHAFAWFKTECAGAACAFRTTCTSEACCRSTVSAFVIECLWPCQWFPFVCLLLVRPGKSMFTV